MDNDSPISASARAKIRIRIKGVDYRMADQTAADIIASVVGTGARISGPFPLPSQVEEPRTALREEIRSHRRLIEIIHSFPTRRSSEIGRASCRERVYRRGRCGGGTRRRSSGWSR